MDLPVSPPVAPMLARAVTAVPTDPGEWSYEPKWDGFRALIFRDGDEVVVLSRNGKELGRYFPELVDALREQIAPRCVLDGEIVVPREVPDTEAAGTRLRLDWESLSQRIHPAASRIATLAKETPAHFVGFDALADGSQALLDAPFDTRRAALLELVDSGGDGRCHVTRVTDDPDLGARWLALFEGAGLDGVIAKRRRGPYLQNKRDMAKIKHARDADCVVIGYRVHKSGEGVGSLLLGLHDADGVLQMVGGAAAFTARERVRLLAELEPLRTGDTPADGEPSRWNTGADKHWYPIRPERVCEVHYDQMEGHLGAVTRFRHTVRLVRWRPDRDPASCTFDQLDVPLTYDLSDVLEAS